MDRRTFLKGSVAGLALMALAKSLPVARASPDSPIRVQSIDSVPSNVKTVAERFTATMNGCSLWVRSMVLRYRATPPGWPPLPSQPHFTGWVFFFGPEEAGEDIDLMLSVGVPDDPTFPVFYELARLGGGPITVWKDGTVLVTFIPGIPGPPGVDSGPLPGYYIGYV